MSTVVPPHPATSTHAPTVSRPRPTAAPSGGGPRPRLRALDGLRLVAALMVVSFHWTGVNRVPEVWHGTPAKLMPGLHLYTAYGFLGVQMFFLISGFVICMSCWGKTPRQYFTSRVVRLMPAYWVAVILTALVVDFVATARHRVHLRFSDVLSNLTMLQQPMGVAEADTVYWTLWVELRFYLLFAIVVALGLTYRRVLAFCGIWMFLSVIAIKGDNLLLRTFVMPEYAPYFIAGIAMFLIYRFGTNWLLLGVVGFSWLVAQNQLLGTKGSYQYGVMHSLSWDVMAWFSVVAFGVVLAVAMGAFDRVQWKWLTTAGALTYPVYLLHQEIGYALIRWARNEGMDLPVTLLGTLAVVLLLAWIVHRYAERPLSALLKRMLDAPGLTLPKTDPPVRRRATNAERNAMDTAGSAG
ncbi:MULTISPECIES: acyltransferase [unclassified Streptomyces]|uniref:acyltransferase family protein n=1 Tax=unclassified Streptomyces TaxID=2593676 RepID=UPI00109E54FF|nr:acyltransferase [Streptomyces sp. A1136]THA55985.1 acyltransferase [Streptomyces sp. A1136]